MKVLSLGPRFCSEPGLGPVERLAIARFITVKVSELDKARCVGEAAGVVTSKQHRVPSSARLNSLVNDLAVKDLSRNIQHVASSGRCSVSVWGALSKEGLGPLVRLRGKFNAEAYCDLFESVVVPSALDGQFPDGLYFFQQDRSPIHMAKSTTRVLEELGMMLYEWPPQGANVNIIENVWGAMKKALSRRRMRCGSQDALWAAVKEEW
ncbi:hypothetical protein HPB52_014354 [Rhipicephalus sanguineus]|uniref:Tc1-like transposase DDE domain-containing protein n=1 Tax=Rhipicephalus sanguineus TaxID=34632 RepID=A0A9D4PK01_RHISA|nr:hypothetical protein HPB52_014354 [Rhipicephalus sanguineus]